MIFGGTDANEKNGYNANRDKNDLWALNLITTAWSEIVPSGTKPTKRIAHSAVCHNDKMWVFGGFGSAVQSDDDLYSLELTTYIWKKITITGSKPSTMEMR